MSFKTTLTMIALCASFTPAFAGNQMVAFNCYDTASFIGTHPILAGGEDFLSFTGLAAGTYDFELTLSGSHIDLTSIELDGQSGTIESNGDLLFADVVGSGSSPFELALTGSALSGRANYSGQLDVTAVPEAGTAAMLGVGLGLLGLIGRLRKSRHS